MGNTYRGGLAAFALLAGLSGCSRLHPVEGQLVWADGQPAKELEGSMVYFLSTEHRTVSRSLVRAEGRFELTTERPEARGADGVPPGRHRVYIIDGPPPLIVLNKGLLALVEGFKSADHHLLGRVIAARL